MMDIINIVLTCVFLCVMNTGVIFIMDKIRKLTGDGSVSGCRSSSLYNDILWN